uniref:hypothetical protein n=1 Tax=Salmonella sp. s58408 TaxID=3159701 RepID=UPI0039812A11
QNYRTNLNNPAALPHNTASSSANQPNRIKATLIRSFLLPLLLAVCIVEARLRSGDLLIRTVFRAS